MKKSGFIFLVVILTAIFIFSGCLSRPAAEVETEGPTALPTMDGTPTPRVIPTYVQTPTPKPRATHNPLPTPTPTLEPTTALFPEPTSNMLELYDYTHSSLSRGRFKTTDAQDYIFNENVFHLDNEYNYCLEMLTTGMKNLGQNNMEIMLSLIRNTLLILMSIMSLTMIFV